jgi:flagellum-specific peptidoglycan hydrolase FlgJ
MKYLSLFIILIFTSFHCTNPYEAQCKKYKKIAEYYQKNCGVPSSVQLAQFIIESGAGRSKLANDAKNLFGIRCGDEWNGQKHYVKSGCWRCYETRLASWDDYINFIVKYYPNAVGKNYKYYGKLEGYGGDGYWQKVEKIIKKYKLYVYD